MQPDLLISERDHDIPLYQLKFQETTDEGELIVSWDHWEGDSLPVPAIYFDAHALIFSAYVLADNGEMILCDGNWDWDWLVKNSHRLGRGYISPPSFEWTI